MSERPSAKLSFGETSAPALLSAARARISAPGARTWDEIEAAVSARARSLLEQNAHRASDPPTQQWLTTSSLVLAAFQELESLASTTEVLSILRDALTAPFKERVSQYLVARFGISSDAPDEDFARVSENFKRRGEERFGKAFVYVQDVQDATHSYTNIQRCFFNDFFRANGAPQVTSVFCALDSDLPRFFGPVVT